VCQLPLELVLNRRRCPAEYYSAPASIQAMMALLRFSAREGRHGMETRAP
jgi:hypothetical protein